MRTGKLPEHTFKRSVINPIRYRSKEVSFRAAVGHDGAVLGDMVTSMATTAFYYRGNECYALDNALNNIVAAGGRPHSVSVGILLPEHSEEKVLREITGNLSVQAEQNQIDIIAGETALVPTVSAPTVTITAYGTRLWDNRHQQAEPDMDIVMTKWTGLYGGAILAKIKGEELTSRYPASYIKKAADYMELTSLLPELRVLESMTAGQRDCIYAAHDVSSGGVFGALWQILSACRLGAEISLSAIPVKQEIIEVSEYFDLNPYMMNGQGSLLLVARDGETLADRFREEGIAAAVIGKTTQSNDRKLIMKDEERFLTPPKGDALNAVFYGQPLPV